MTSINLLLANEMENSPPSNDSFLRLACTCEQTCESVWPPNISLFVSSTCVHLRQLASPFGQGFNALRVIDERTYGLHILNLDLPRSSFVIRVQQSFPSLTIPVPLWFIIISLVFLCLINLFYYVIIH